MKYILILALALCVGCGEPEKTEAQKNGEWLGKQAKATAEALGSARENLVQGAQDFWKGVKAGYNE